MKLYSSACAYFQIFRAVHFAVHFRVSVSVRVGRIGHELLIFLLRFARKNLITLYPALATSTRFARLVYRLRPSILPIRYKKYSRAKLCFMLFIFMRVGRIELPTHPWQGCILPLNHTRTLILLLISKTNVQAQYNICLLCLLHLIYNLLFSLWQCWRANISVF